MNNHRIGTPHFKHLTLTKTICCALAGLMNTFSAGKVLDEVTIDICQQDQELTSYFQYTLQNANITDIELISNKDLKTTKVRMQMSYTKIAWRFVPRDKTNRATAPMSMGYDLERAVAL